MTGLEKALLDAQEALDRTQVAADLQAMLEAGMPLVDRSGQPLRYDLGELQLSLNVPGNVGLCQRLLRDAQRWHDEHPPSDAPPCPAAGTGEVAAHQAAADLQGGGSFSPAQIAAWDVLREVVAAESSPFLLDAVAVRLLRPLTGAEKREILEEREALVDALAARIALATTGKPFDGGA